MSDRIKFFIRVRQCTPVFANVYFCFSGIHFSRKDSPSLPIILIKKSSISRNLITCPYTASLSKFDYLWIYMHLIEVWKQVSIWEKVCLWKKIVHGNSIDEKQENEKHSIEKNANLKYKNEN